MVDMNLPKEVCCVQNSVFEPEFWDFLLQFCPSELQDFSCLTEPLTSLWPSVLFKCFSKARYYITIIKLELSTEIFIYSLGFPHMFLNTYIVSI